MQLLSENDEDDVLIDDYSCFDMNNPSKSNQEEILEKTTHSEQAKRYRLKIKPETNKEGDNLRNDDIQTPLEISDSKSSINYEARQNNLSIPLLSSSSLTSTSSFNLSSSVSNDSPSASNPLNSSYGSSTELDKSMLLKSKRGYIKQNSQNNSNLSISLSHQTKNSCFLTKAISTPSIVEKSNQENGVKNMIAMINENSM